MANRRSLASVVIAFAFLATVSAAVGKTETSDLECMFLGYPELEYDGFDRTEVALLLNIYALHSYANF